MNDDILKRNAVNVTGTGPRTLVFGHGFGCDQQMWRFITPDLARDFRIVTFDYVGAGRSDFDAWDPQRYGSLVGYAQDVQDVCQALGLRDAVFIGHSISGMLGLMASLAEPGLFSKLVMIGSSPCFTNDPPYVGGFEHEDIASLLDLMERNLLSWANYLAPVAMGNPDQPQLSQELAASFCAGDPRIARRFAHLVFYADLRELLPRVAVPTLILQCAQDSIAPQEVGQYMHAHMPGSTLRLMRATGHCPHMSQPHETLHALRDYLGAAALR